MLAGNQGRSGGPRVDFKFCPCPGYTLMKIHFTRRALMQQFNELFKSVSWIFLFHKIFANKKSFKAVVPEHSDIFD